MLWKTRNFDELKLLCRDGTLKSERITLELDGVYYLDQAPVITILIISQFYRNFILTHDFGKILNCLCSMQNLY